MCRHEQKGLCQKVKGKTCDPGMKGCLLYARMKKYSIQQTEQTKKTETPKVGMAGSDQS